MGKTNIDSYFLITAINIDDNKVTYNIKDLNDGVSFSISEIKQFSINDIVSKWLKGILLDNGFINTNIKYKFVTNALPLKFNGYVRNGLNTVEDLKIIPDGKTRALSKIGMKILSLDKTMSDIN